jgi:hypothetical protein
VRSHEGRIAVPASVVEIGAATFNDCYELASVNFAPGSKLTTIGHGAFASTGLATFHMPKGVKEIGVDWKDVEDALDTGGRLPRGPFDFCTFLTSVTFPSDSELTKIKNEAFSFTRLTAFEVPMGVTEIQAGAFSGCGQLSTFTFASTTNLVIQAPGTWTSRAGKSVSADSFNFCAGKPSFGRSVFSGTPLEKLITEC